MKILSGTGPRRRENNGGRSGDIIVHTQINVRGNSRQGVNLVHDFLPLTTSDSYTPWGRGRRG